MIVHMTKETIERRMFVEHSIVWRAEFFNADGSGYTSGQGNFRAMHATKISGLERTV